MIRVTTDIVKRLKNPTAIVSTHHQLLQRCSVSGTAKGKAKVKAGLALKRSKITIKKGGPPTSEAKSSGGQRKTEFEEMADKCPNATAPVRFLKPKERAREAEREKMGLVSEARKKEMENLKKLAKGSGADGGFVGIGTPGLDLISLGVVDGDKVPKYQLTVEDGMRLAKEYSRILMRQHREKQKADSLFLRCKKEAIDALPEGLREAALVPDLTPIPPNRFMATLSPPIEGYQESIKASQMNKAVKAKLR